MLHAIKAKCPDNSLKNIDDILKAYERVMDDTLVKGESFIIPDVVTLKPSTRKERQGRHPQTGEAITIPAQRRVKVIMSKCLKELMNR